MVTTVWHQRHIHVATDGGYMDVWVEINDQGEYTILRPTNVPASVVQAVRQEQLRQQRLTAAENRSKALMIRLLTPAQRSTYDRDKQVYVTGSSGTEYRIDCSGGYSGNIHALDENRHRRWSYCIYPNYQPRTYSERFPLHDAFLGQLLLLATDEQEFLNVAEPC